MQIVNRHLELCDSVNKYSWLAFNLGKRMNVDSV